MCWNGFLAQGRYLFETPPQALMSLNRLGTDVNGIEAVFISHHHGDHYLGIPMLFLHWKYMGRSAPVTIVGPPGTERVVRQLCALSFPGMDETPMPVRWVELAPGGQAKVGELRVEAFAAKHDLKLDICLAFRCTVDGLTFGYTGDTAICDSILEVARTSSILVSECAEFDRRTPFHMNLAHDIPTLRQAMRPQGRLVLTHLSPAIRTTELPGTTVARDLASYHFTAS